MSKNSKGGCGCGGSGGCGGAGGGCGCGGKTSAQCVSGDAGCTTCNDQGFSRPLFFAGQLLTEEDLQALGDYVVNKNRLHNRHLFGDGVVCGLEVTCDPCGGGKVVIQPGYALDCCGNDLTLPCPAELNVNAMVRDLRRNLLGGYDCGDPCATKKKRPEPTPQAEERPSSTLPGAAAPGGQQPGQTAEEEEEEPSTLRHYCLYARYCEEKTDPVSPYATGDGCTFQACQPTRVREGVAFELRCRSCECGHEDIISRLCACVGDLQVTRENSRNANSLRAFARLNTLSERSYSAATLTPADASRSYANFVTSARTLNNTAFFSRSTARAAARPAGEEQPETDTADTQERSAAPEATPVSKDELERSVLSIRDAATHLAAYYSAGEAGALPAAEKANEEEIAAAKQSLLGSTEAARAALATADASAPEYAYYVSIVEGAELLARSENPGAEIGANELRAMRSGVFMSAQATQTTRQKAEALREALLDALDASPRLGDCALRRDVAAIRIPASDAGGNESLVEPAAALERAWERYLMDCACLAFNPPCATCDDTGVLLACLVIDEATCEVVEICNLKRKFVISPTALRYWLPPLNWLGLLLEELCCGESPCAEEPAPTTDRDPRASLANSYSALPRDTRQDARRGFARTLAKFCDLDIIRALYGGTAIRDYSSLKTQYSTKLGERTNIMSGLSAFRRSSAGTETAAAATTPAEASAAARQPTEIVAEAVRDPATREALFRAFEPELTKSVPTREEVSREVREVVERRLADAQPAAAEPDEAALDRKVEERVAAALSDERFNARLLDAVKSEPVTKFIGEVVGSVSAEPGAAAATTADAAVAAVESALDKLKLTNVAKDLRDLKNAKKENAELKKSLAALEERLAKLERT
ncbi:MAG TPA: hypothetical protein VN282_19130 [Pyrinomonadaceae bacterium]|nr:hypothetical protein [Pyrinomonadaceae bacterium]